METQQMILPSTQMMKLITGFWTSCCIYTAAKLDLADLLSKDPQTAAELAEKTGTHASSLYRMLRALASQDIFTEDEHGVFSNTELSETLRSDIPGSMKAMSIAQLGDHFNAWGNLLHSVKTGEVAFDNVEGMNIWQYYEEHPADGANFMKAMTGSTIAAIKNVIPAYDFSSFETIVDVGGGNGAFLIAILDKTPNIQGIVFDQDYVIEKTKIEIAKNNFGTRCIVHSGSFFDFIPEAADVYVMKHVLHDWNDEKSIQILNNCKKAMKSGSKLLVIEAIIPKGNTPHPGKFMDINMMAMTGGKERTEEEYSMLFGKAGLSISDIIHTGSPTLSILELIKK